MKSPVNILGPCMSINLVCALPQQEEFGPGRDEGWCCHQPKQPGLLNAADTFQQQRVGSSIPRDFEALYIVDLETELPEKGCYQS